MLASKRTRDGTNRTRRVPKNTGAETNRPKTERKGREKNERDGGEPGIRKSLGRGDEVEKAL